MGAITRCTARIAAAFVFGALCPSLAAAQTSAGPDLRVSDPRLARALSRLVAGSPTAAGVVAALGESRLPVSIGTPAELSAPAPRGSGLPDAAGLAAPMGPQLAWVAIRAAVEPGGGAVWAGTVEEAWVVVDVDRIERLIETQGRRDAQARVDDDLIVALAHELVAHVGSVARSRRLSDFCDDPPAGTGGRGALACSLRVENAVRRELNRNLGLRLRERRSYALDVMNFAHAGAR